MNPVQMRNVSFSYGSAPLLDQVDFDLEPGCFCILEGANGAGKSTLLKLILGELKPMVGIVQVLGADPSGRGFKGGIGYVPQQAPEDYRHFPVTVRELVQSGLYPKSHPVLPYRSHHREIAANAIRAFGLAGLERRLIGELSGGQFQRALLARAMACTPELLVLDEPTSNLDEESAIDLVLNIAQASRDLGTAALLVTHDLARLPKLYDRVVELQNGHIIDMAG